MSFHSAGSAALSLQQSPEATPSASLHRPAPAGVSPLYQSGRDANSGRRVQGRCFLSCPVCFAPPDVQKLAKNAVYSLHRGEGNKAADQLTKAGGAVTPQTAALPASSLA